MKIKEHGWKRTKQSDDNLFVCASHSSYWRLRVCTEAQTTSTSSLAACRRDPEVELSWVRLSAASLRTSSPASRGETDFSTTSEARRGPSRRVGTLLSYPSLSFTFPSVLFFGFVFLCILFYLFLFSHFFLSLAFRISVPVFTFVFIIIYLFVSSDILSLA